MFFFIISVLLLTVTIEFNKTSKFSALIMTPTRELCMQIGKETRKFTKSLNLHVVCVYGGTGISEQIAELKRGAEIIVCTPGRMIDMLAANSGKSSGEIVSLKKINFYKKYNNVVNSLGSVDKGDCLSLHRTNFL